MRLFSPRSEERKRTLLRKRAEYAQQPSASTSAVGYGGNGYWPEAEASGSGLPRLVPEGRLSAAALPEGRVLAPPPPLREAPRSPHSPGGRSMAEQLAAGGINSRAKHGDIWRYNTSGTLSYEMGKKVWRSPVADTSGRPAGAIMRPRFIPPPGQSHWREPEADPNAISKVRLEGGGCGRCFCEM